MDKVRYFKLGVKMSKKDKLDEVTQELWRQMPKFSKTKTIRVIICLILSLNISFKSNSQNQVDIRQHLNNPETLAKLYFNYIVRVVSYDKEGNSLGWGNGCFIDSTGDIITARHVLLIPNTHNAYIMVVSGEYFPITQIIAEDIEADLIRASTNISQYYKINSNLKIDSAFIPKLHDSVYYFGWTPLPETIADTLLSEHERVIFKTGAIGTFKGTIINIEQNESDESIFFWTSINIYQGNSGGPLFNKNGKIIGIAHATPNIAMIKESELEMNKTYGIFTSINAALNLKANKGIEYLE